LHKTVFPERAVQELNVKKNDVVVDATFGEGGHSRRILDIIGNDGVLIVLDKDPKAIQIAEKLKQSFFNIFPIHEDFREMDTAVNDAGFDQVNGILLDLGMAQGQLEDPGRGFSFRREERLDMRMNPLEELDAFHIVNHYSEKELSQIIEEYGEDYRARKIAKAIIQAREQGEIKTTTQLADLVTSIAKPKERFRRTHPATKTFQALRIAVNQELDSLSIVLEKAVSLLLPGGRLVVISFHSLEDRIVKFYFREQHKEQNIQLITKKPLTVLEDELKENPRARSAKMRICEKL